MDRELLGSLHPDDIEQLLGKVADCHAGLMAETVSLVQEVIDRELWKADGSRSAAGWVAERLQIGEGEARRLCRAAGALEGFAGLHQALGDGEVSWAKTLPLTELCGDDKGEERWLVDAQALTVEQLETLARRRRQEERESEEAERDDRRNRLHLRPKPEKNRLDYWGSAYGDDAVRLQQVVEHLAKNELRGLPGEPADPWEARCGDALAVLASATLGGISRDRATINLHLDERAARTNGLLGEASMKPPFDYRATPSIIERLFCDGRCRLIYDGADGLPAAWTNAAHPPPAIEQAVLRRDVHCVIKGCRSRHGEIHHIVWRTRGGKTVIENLVFVCWRHHRMIHDHGWSLTGTAGNLTWCRPDGSVVWTTGRPPDQLVA